MVEFMDPSATLCNALPNVIGGECEVSCALGFRPFGAVVCTEKGGLPVDHIGSLKAFFSMLFAQSVVAATIRNAIRRDFRCQLVLKSRKTQNSGVGNQELPVVSAVPADRVSGGSIYPFRRTPRATCRSL